MGSSRCARWEGATPRKCCSSNHRQEREEEADHSFYKVGRHCFPQLFALPIAGGCRAKKLHSPHFLIAFNKGREHKGASAYMPATVPVPCSSGRLRASSKSWVCGASEPAATLRGEADSSCAASGVRCQGSGLAISYSLHKKYNMKNIHIYVWLGSKQMLTKHT